MHHLQPSIEFVSFVFMSQGAVDYQSCHGGSGKLASDADPPETPAVLRVGSGDATSGLSCEQSPFSADRLRAKPEEY